MQCSKYVAHLALAVSLVRAPWHLMSRSTHSDVRRVASIASVVSTLPSPAALELVELAASTQEARTSTTSVTPTKRSHPMGMLRGRVTDRTRAGAPHGEGHVEAQFVEPLPDSREEARDVWSIRLLRGGIVDSSGAFEVKTLGLGTWIATCKFPYRAPVQTKFTITRDGECIEHDFELPELRTVRVKLHDLDGKPLVAKLDASDTQIGELISPFVCSAAPTIGASPYANGVALVSHSRLVGKGLGDPWREIETEWRERMWVGVALGDHTLAFQEVASDAEDVLLVTSRVALTSALGSLEVRVLDDQWSLPIAEVGVKIPNECTSRPYSNGRVTNESGSVKFDGLLPGDAPVSVHRDGFVCSVRMPNVTTAHIVAGKATSIDVHMELAISISGVVKDENGRPSTRVVRAMPARNDPMDWSDFADAYPTADGSFVIDGLSHREYVVLDARSFAANNSNSPTYTKWYVPPHSVFVDAREGSVANVALVITGQDDPVPGAKSPR